MSRGLDTPGEVSLWYDNPQTTTLARVEDAYARGDDPRDDAGQTRNRKLYVHLLDGGIADNLGIYEPLRMLNSGETLTRISTGRIKKLIFVTINARSFAPSGLDERQATPGIIDMLLASINAPIDRATAGLAARLRSLLFDEFRQATPDNPVNRARLRALAENTALVSIDFDAIVNEACRRKYHSIPTSWSLDARQIDALMLVGGALLANDPEFQKLLRLTGGTTSKNLPSIAQACAAL